MNISRTESTTSFSSTSASQNTSGIEKEIQNLRNKLQQLQKDITSLQAEKAKGSTTADKEIADCQKTYQTYTAELANKQQELAQIKKESSQSTSSIEKTSSTTNQTAKEEKAGDINNNIHSTLKYDTFVEGLEDPAKQKDVTYHLEKNSDNNEVIVFNQNKE